MLYYDYNKTISNTSKASFNAPPSKKKAAACSNLCLPSNAKAFFNAALRQRSSVKLFAKNCKKINQKLFEKSVERTLIT